MVVGSGGEPARHGRMRASRADRERAIELLKAAYVQDRLTKDELDARVGQVLAARTYADLDAVTDDIPVSAKLPLSQTTLTALSPHVPRRTEVGRAIKFGASALGVVVVATGTVAGVASSPLAGVAIVVAALLLAAFTAGFAALVIRLTLVAEEKSRRRKRSRGRTPPRPGPGPSDPATWRPRSAPPRPHGGDPALASALWTAPHKPRRSTTAWTNSIACR